jgi:hypothetical protein
MTAQITDVLHYENQKLSMCTLPLSVYFSLTTEPEFEVECTALWRGYIATWEIKDNRLYLIDIHATFKNGENVTLGTLFPSYPKRVFAHWYSGKIRAPKGGLIDYVHGGFASKYEQDLIFQIKKGEVIDFEIRQLE